MTPQEAKNIKIGIGVTAALVVGYFLFLKKDNGGESQDPTGNVGGGTNTGGIVFDANKVRLKLFDAMNRFGTDENTIVSTLRTVTPAQFAQVFQKFGLERYDDWLGYKTSYATERDLAYWLKAELSEDEYLNLQRKYPNYL